MGVQNFIGNIAYMISPYFLAIMYMPVFGDVVNGASYLALIIAAVAIGLGILPAIFLRERLKDIAAQEDDGPGGSRRHRRWTSARLRHDAQIQAVPEALRRDLPRLQRLHPDCGVPVLRDHLLRLRQGDQEAGAVFVGLFGPRAGVRGASRHLRSSRGSPRRSASGARSSSRPACR
jgi:hypothetical protein